MQGFLKERYISIDHLISMVIEARDNIAALHHGSLNHVVAYIGKSVSPLLSVL
jgi:hypothetical protein